MISINTSDLEREYIGILERDLYDVGQVEKDPLGNAIYLFFISRNKIKTSITENLIDWANSYVHTVLGQHKLSRFQDKDVTSAILCYYSLKQLDCLKVVVDVKLIDSLLDRYCSRDRYFDEFTHSCIILFSLYDIKEGITSYQKVLASILKAVNSPEVMNDPKNLVFSAILLDATQDVQLLKNLLHITLGHINEKSIPYNDSIYYAWLVWQYKELFEKNALTRVRGYVREVIEGLRWSLIEKEELEEIESIYGREEGPMVLSKIQISVSLDLVSSYNKEPGILNKLDHTVILADLRVDAVKQKINETKKTVSLLGDASVLLQSAEKKILDAETKLAEDPDACLDLLGEAMESLCRTYLTQRKIPFKALSGLELHDSVIKDWKEKSSLPWTDLKYQTGLRHILRVWALKKHEAYSTNLLEEAYFILLGWRGCFEIIRMIKETNPVS
ncbi:hypothetical protein Ngar_c19420 [Candidatus Nitrososphaera gargensis Ga9.2]|uniref:Uncharacterized protein n=2 Tax=Candidatus Nitrososphaera gargensis TaxID=497727 RepID=K0IN73_NITGG|nr:hypothetical protein Ngar_c19420 [Candidatus Nitrososphaera gargensis Ga9.2]